MAKRWAGDEEEAKRYYADLSPPEQAVLMTLVGKPEGVTAPEILENVRTRFPVNGGTVALLLSRLKERNLATEDDEATYGAPACWIIRKAGLEYLGERDLL